MVQTLFVMAQVMQQPIRLESTFELPLQENLSDGHAMARLRRMSPAQKAAHLNGMANSKFESKRVRVTVTPNGTVRAEEVLREGTSDPDAMPVTEYLVAKEAGVYKTLRGLSDVSAELQVYVDLFKQDVTLGQTELSELLPKGSFQLPSQLSAQIEASIRSVVEGISPRLKLAVPTVVHATEAYVTEVRGRALKALHLAMLGQRGMRHNLTGVQVRALPDIPSFEYDQQAMQRIIGEMPLPAPALSRDRALSLKNADMTPMALNEAIIARGEHISGDTPTDVNPVNGEPGRRFWGPDPSGGQGSGEGDQPDEGQKPGQKPMDPSIVEIDLNTYAEALSSVVELPNLRPKNGQTEHVEEVPGDWTHRRDGTPHAPIIIEKAFARGVADMRMKGDKRDLRKLNAVERLKLLKTGMAKLDLNNDWAVQHFEEQPSPEINAQVTLMMDMSGSYNQFVKKTKQMFYDLRALLLLKYKKVEFRFVAFDGSAHAFEDPEEFFRLQLGGGTSYATGLKTVLKVQEEFPESQWDRFTVIAGDMEDYDATDLEKTLDEVRLNSQFLASVKMSNFQSPAPAHIEQLLRQWHQSDPYVSFVDLSPNNNYEPLILRRLFKNDEKSN
jgi:uncharacterized sporulation protein YeaH/YhbH (DUF444 family)